MATQNSPSIRGYFVCTLRGPREIYPTRGRGRELLGPWGLALPPVGPPLRGVSIRSELIESLRQTRIICHACADPPTSIIRTCDQRGHAIAGGIARADARAARGRSAGDLRRS